jgi:hypothetical protein
MLWLMDSRIEVGTVEFHPRMSIAFVPVIVFEATPDGNRPVAPAASAPVTEDTGINTALFIFQLSENLNTAFLRGSSHAA